MQATCPPASQEVFRDRFWARSSATATKFAVGSQMMARELKQSLHYYFSKNQEDNVASPETVEILKEYYIPDYILLPELVSKEVCEIPLCPVIIFINSKSGGQLGGELLQTCRTLLNKNQVFELGEKTPDKVLHQLYFNLEKHKQNGDNLATEIMKTLRIIVAGGDGTAGWLLGVVSDLKLSPPPPIATMPLGTGNNLPFSFGWGKKNPGTNYQSVKAFLRRVKDAKEMKIDSWHIVMRMRAPREGSCDPIPPLDLPHSLHAFNRISPTKEINEEGYCTFRGGFWNYFSMGMDAQVSYAFHKERRLRPEKFKKQLVNQATYAKLSCKQGWFCACLTQPSSRNIANLAKVKIMKTPGQWIDLHIPPCIRSIVCLNLPSFSGGLNPWGKPSKQKHHSRDITPPYVDDGFLEVVGFHDAWHGLFLFMPNGHGTRLAQANRIRFEFHKGAADHTFMRLDGEPWKQPLPINEDAVMIEISHFGQANILANTPCRSRSISTPNLSTCSEDDLCDSSNDDEFEEGSEERKKFGAADTFRLPDDFDTTRLS